MFKMKMILLIKKMCIRDRVKVLHSTDKWFGVTYKADKEEVVKEIKRLIDSGVYK